MTRFTPGFEWNDRKMPVELNNRLYETDEEGFLTNPGEWSEALAEKMALDDNCELGSDHWVAINILRDYYAKFAIAPPVRVLVRKMGKELSREKANSPYLYELFPFGPAKQACRYAGLPKPTGCI